MQAVFNFVCEIVNGSTAKFEIDTAAPFNPIVQDVTKKGEPRFYGLKSIVHYGALPQTYESPQHVDAWTQAQGDGDPIDVCDISSLPTVSGAAYTVKVLGVLAMIDGGECDWKLLAVRTDDPLAATVSDIKTAPEGIKRKADAIREWFRTYKIPEGKGENSFAFDGAWLDLDTALEVIQSTHNQWKDAFAVPKAARGKKGPWIPDNWQAPHPHAYAPAAGAAALAIGTTTQAPPLV